MKILALDQSTISSGYSIWNEKGTLLKSGVIKAKDIKEMYFSLLELIKEIKPKKVIIEDIYYSPKTVNNFKPLARLQGLIMSICYQKKIDIIIITANEWKKAFGIKQGKTKRNEQKQECKLIVEEKFGIKVGTDESDAIGIGSWYFTSRE